ncbi:MAG TPA: cytochrome P450 [Spongiibacteraceae bacterium]|nr:cytochrome P450 [Spongiibacteraceae bacterium]HCS28220.1 cytochrome P450 [Spongiibacteraceae bacterium]
MSTSHADYSYVKAKDNKKLDHLPGKYGLPLIGYTFPFLVEPYNVLDQIYKSYGPICKASLTFNRMAVALGPDYIKLLTLDQEQIFSPRMGYDGPLGDFFAGGLLMRDFGEHKVHRRIMQTAFKNDAMRGYVEDIHGVIEKSLPAWGEQKDFKFYPHVKELLLDIASKVFLGMDMEGPETNKLNQDFLDMMSATVSLIRKDWPGLLYRRGMNGRRALEKFFIDIVPEKRQSSGRDMASFFSKETDEDGNLFSEQVVGDHLIFLMLAAHDTTTSALTMTASFLARHQDWQDRIRDEVASLNKSHIDFDDLGDNLKDTEMLFKEVLRLHPPVPQLMRRTVRDTEIDGHHIPAHTLVQASPLYTHRMEEWWTNPHNFDPDRFGPGREEHKKHPFMWAPFGGGAHKCIGLHFAGMVFKCVLADILPKYRLKFIDGYQYPAKVQHFPFAKPLDDMPLILEKL